MTTSFSVKVPKMVQRQLAKAKPQPGRIYQVIDLGIQPGGIYEDSHKMMITWELPNDLLLGGDHKGKPLSLSQEFPIKFGPKAGLRLKLLNVLYGYNAEDKLDADAFALDDLIGKSAMLYIKHKASAKDPSVQVDSISMISELPEEINVPAPINKPLVFTLSNFDESVFKTLPEWIQKKINNRLENVGDKPKSQGKPNVGKAEVDGAAF